MITRIEIDGFKTFQEFSVDLAPFQVIIGPNGCGKSNLFDALRLLSRLTTQDLHTALQDLRGQPFTLLPDGKLVERIQIGIEMLVGVFVYNPGATKREPITVYDDWGDQFPISNARLRYDLEINRRQDSKSGFVELFIRGEALKSIPPEEDNWSRLHGGDAFHAWLHSGSNKTSQSYMNTSEDRPGENTTIYLIPERSTSGKRGKDVGYQSGRIERTLLSRVETTEYPHVLAARQEMQRWEFLHLNVDHLRLPSMLTTDGPSMVIGNNIPFLLARLEKEEPQVFRSVSRDLANLVPGVKQVEVQFNIARNQYEVLLRMQDDRRFALPGLSDGTLRLLALVTAKNTLSRRSLLCLEEPEDAVHPGILGKLVRFLRGMTTDLRDPDSAATSWQQVIATTHSPQLVSHLDLSRNELLFADMTMRIKPKAFSMQTTRLFPVLPGKPEGPEQAYGLHRVIEYLNNSDVETQRDSLQETFAR
jgi:predicted ATPase